MPSDNSSSQPSDGGTSLKAEIVANIPVKQPNGQISAIAGQSTNGVQPQPDAKKVVKSPQPIPKNLQLPKPLKTPTEPRPVLAITTASLIAAGLSAAAFFAFRQG